MAGTTWLQINPLHPADHKPSRDGTGLPIDRIAHNVLGERQASAAARAGEDEVQGAEVLALQGAADMVNVAGPALFIELHEEGLRRFGTSVAQSSITSADMATQPAG